MRLAGRFAKRAVDIVVSALALIVLSPVMLGIALAVRRKLGSPILFRQERPGLHGAPFTLYKFRTMTDARDSRGALLPDAQRLTPFGAGLRRATLDELPELLNVLKGDMSLVGPRPLLMQYLDRYTPEQRRRHDVKPGLTGWAVVHGRNAIAWEERLALDVWYVDNGSLGLDAQILWKTVSLVLHSRGVSAKDHATMPEFTGSSGRQRPDE